MEDNHRMIKYFRIKLSYIKNKKINETKKYYDLQEECNTNIRWERIFNIILASLVIYIDLPLLMNLNSIIKLNNLIIFNLSSVIMLAGVGITINHDKKILKREKKKFDAKIGNLKELERTYTTEINELVKKEDEHYNQINNKLGEKERLEKLKRNLEFLQALKENSKEKSLKLSLNGKKM